MAKHRKIGRPGPYGPYDTLDERAAVPKRRRLYHSGAPDSAIAVAIRKARKSAGLTQQQLADLAKVPRSNLARWETAHRSVTVEDWERLRAFLPELPEGHPKRLNYGRTVVLAR